MCNVSWCNGTPNKSGKGYCRRHYDQLRKYGKILDVRGRNDQNRYKIDGDIAMIEITDSHDNYVCTTMVDASLIDSIIEHRWTSNGNGYIRTFDGTTPVYLHRFVTNAPDGMDVDHVNRNRLDNRLCNLRIVRHIDNCQNRGKHGSIVFVSGRNLSKPYAASITRNGEHMHVGYFATKEEAQLALDRY